MFTEPKTSGRELLTVVSDGNLTIVYSDRAAYTNTVQRIPIARRAWQFPVVSPRLTVFCFLDLLGRMRFDVQVGAGSDEKQQQHGGDHE